MIIITHYWEHPHDESLRYEGSLQECSDIQRAQGGEIGRVVDGGDFGLRDEVISED